MRQAVDNSLVRNPRLSPGVFLQSTLKTAPWSDLGGALRVRIRILLSTTQLTYHRLLPE